MMERPILTENARLIESYHYLYRQGIFTDQEFGEIKRRLLAKDLSGDAGQVQTENLSDTGEKNPVLERRRKEKSCAVCGKPFMGYGPARYCSQACREKAKERNTGPGKEEMP